MRSILVTALVLAAAGCGRISFNNGVYSKDGVDLPHDRWVALAVPEGTAHLELAAAIGDITLAAGAAALEVRVFSELENDGTVALVDGEPVVTSASGHAVAIDGVRGTIPAATDLALTSGTGDVQLEGLEGAPHLRIKCGTGDIQLADAVLDDVVIESGTGDVKLEGSRLARLDARCGTGDIRLRLDSHVAGGRLKSGTGDVVLSGGSDIGSTATDFGTGELRSGD
jgi:hypothetical protein